MYYIYIHMLYPHGIGPSSRTAPPARFQQMRQQQIVQLQALSFPWKARNAPKTSGAKHLGMI